MVPAHAGTAVQPPVFHAAAHPKASAKTGLSANARIAGALKADHTRTRASLSASTGTSGTSSPKIDPKIIGGTTTTISAAPWMAQLWYFDNNGTPKDTSDDISFFCGGTVVSPSKILTAAHCVSGYDWFDHGVVVTGTDQLPTVSDDGTSSDLHGGTETLLVLLIAISIGHLVNWFRSKWFWLPSSPEVFRARHVLAND